MPAANLAPTRDLSAARALHPAKAAGWNLPRRREPSMPPTQRAPGRSPLDQTADDKARYRAR